PSLAPMRDKLGRMGRLRESSFAEGFPLAYMPDQSTKSGGFWTVEYYQPYFDVDTRTVRRSPPRPPMHTHAHAYPQVLKRCYSTLIPTSFSHPYIATHLTPADLYGPFWTLTTLIFSLFVFSSLASSIAVYLSDPAGSSPTDALEYDFGLLSTAVGIVYAYGLAVPILLWLGLRYLGVGEWSVIEAIALWGYGHFVWIPVSVRVDVCGVMPFTEPGAVN
ncbi:hypothetical protein EIP86_011261, partial [Pleurotus ostreatoroseus]